MPPVKAIFKKKSICVPQVTPVPNLKVNGLEVLITEPPLAAIVPKLTVALVIVTPAVEVVNVPFTAVAFFNEMFPIFTTKFPLSPGSIEPL